MEYYVTSIAPAKLCAGANLQLVSSYIKSGQYQHTFTAAVFEELAFRALAFGALYHCCGWRFLPAALPPAIIFGLEHLYQASDVMGAVLTFLLMFACAIWVLWLYLK